MTKNVGFLLVSQGVTAATGVLLLALSARYLGPARFGQYSVLRALVGMVLPLLLGGLRVNMVKEIGRDPEGAPSYLGNLLTLRWAMAAVITVVAVVVVQALPLGRDLELAGYAAILVALSLLWDGVTRAVFIAYERSDYNLKMSLGNGLLVVPLTLGAIWLDWGVAGILAAGAAARFATGQTGLVVAYRRFVRPRLEVNLDRWRAILAGSLPVGVGAMLRQSYSRVDVWLLAALRNSTAAGIFNGAYRVVLQETPVALLVGTAILPRLSLLARVARDQLRAAFEGLLLVALALSMPAAGAVAAAAGLIVGLLLGGKFAASIPALRLIAVALMTAGPNALLYFCLIALGREVTATWCLVVSVAANAALDLALIPLLGVQGACLGTIGAEWLFFVMTLVIVRRALGMGSAWPFVGKPIVAGLAMAGGLVALGPDAPLLGFVVGLVGFVLVFAALRTVRRGFLRGLRKALTPPQEAPAQPPSEGPGQGASGPAPN